MLQLVKAYIWLGLGGYCSASSKLAWSFLNHTSIFALDFIRFHSGWFSGSYGVCFVSANKEKWPEGVAIKMGEGLKQQSNPNTNPIYSVSHIFNLPWILADQFSFVVLTEYIQLDPILLTYEAFLTFLSILLFFVLVWQYII